MATIKSNLTPDMWDYYFKFGGLGLAKTTNAPKLQWMDEMSPFPPPAPPQEANLEVTKSQPATKAVDEINRAAKLEKVAEASRRLLKAFKKATNVPQAVLLLQDAVTALDSTEEVK